MLNRRLGLKQIGVRCLSPTSYELVAMPNFHHYRYRPKRYTPYLRLWHWHDRHPLPAPLNKAAREVLYWGRRLRQQLLAPKPKDGRDEFGDPVASRYDYPTPVRPFEPIPLADVEARFRAIHEANEHLYNGNGSWDPHPFMPLYGSGIPLEEVSERVIGYLAAYEAFDDPVFLQRAEEGGRYLLERRLFANGHLRLEGHLVIELVYSYAGLALLALWEHDRSRTEYLDAARRIADRLLEEHIGGAIDHAVKVAQLLAPLYRITGRESYLQAALRRSSRAVALQLPYGGWPRGDRRIWYHCIIARGVLDTYVATPNTLAYYAERDRLANCITAAFNRVAHAQAPDGSLRVGRGDGSRDGDQRVDPLFEKAKKALYTNSCRLEGGHFVTAPLKLQHYPIRDAMDVLTAGFEELAIQPAAVMAHGHAAAALRAQAFHRLEFETYLVGRYAQFLVRLERQNAHTRRRVGMGEGFLPSSRESKRATSGTVQTNGKDQH